VPASAGSGCDVSPLEVSSLAAAGANSSSMGVELMLGALLVALVTLALGRKDTRRRR
jgi:hypothetical protein